MGARHSSAGSADEATNSSSAPAVPGGFVAAERRVPPSSAQSYSARRPNAAADGARASAEPGPSRPSDGTPTSGGAGRGMPKHRARHVGGTSAEQHRRLALDVLAASGAGRNTASGSLRSTASNDSTPDDSPLSRMLLTSSSFPLHIFAFRGKLTAHASSAIYVYIGIL